MASSYLSDSFRLPLEIPWPVFDHIWKHKSYQVLLLSDGISDLVSLGETRHDKELLFDTLLNQTIVSL